ncbi:hypothetical protein PGTUg99_004399 [Puccinia graminis f. sp. tritici]|uniref:Uncharacterized protein n=1 Tax=Puccinia graminis f. sp. tritici TaxID=56615 RepID=A0A5B0QZ94_PUCGR|nr:hypothetical protein PGTUg99_004399 [Puccinia graminis f. sp. tritici]
MRCFRFNVAACQPSPYTLVLLVQETEQSRFHRLIHGLFNRPPIDHLTIQLIESGSSRRPKDWKHPIHLFHTAIHQDYCSNRLLIASID